MTKKRGTFKHITGATPEKRANRATGTIYLSAGTPPHQDANLDEEER